MLPFADVNLLAVVGATVASMLLGMIWYGPLFGKPWMKLVGLSEKEAAKDMGQTMTLGLLNMFVTNFALALLLLLVKPANLQEGLMLTGLAWFGFMAMDEASNAIWVKSPWKLVYINAAYTLVNLLVATLILMKWPW